MLRDARMIRARSTAVAPSRTTARLALPFAVLMMAAAIWLALASMVFAAPEIPALQGRITDTANLITPEDRALIEAQLKTLEETSTDQVAVLTVPSLGGYAIEEYGLEVARAWGIGQKGKDNGIVLIVAPNERKVRIEVGRKLEPQMTDALSSLIIQNGILPNFRRGDFSGGIRDGVRDIKDVLLGDEDAVRDRAQPGGSGGEGFDTAALIFLAIWIGIFVFIMYQQYKQASTMPSNLDPRSRRARRRGYGRDVVVIPGDSGGWSGGGWSGGGGGGGWSGGGGDFGGGGSSGSW